MWHRPGYSRELDGLRAAVRRLRPGLLPTAAQAKQRERAFARPRVRRAWLTAAVSDTVLQYAVKVRALLASGRTVVCDRYVPDALIDLRILFPELMHGPLVRDVLKVCRKPDHAFLLMLPRDEMLRRMAEKREPFTEPESQRLARYDAYAALSRGTELSVLDSTLPVEVVHRQLCEHVHLV